MSKYANKQFWIDAADRAVASFAQGIIGVAGLDGVGILDVDWGQTLSVAGSFAALSLLTAIAFRGGDKEDNQLR